MTLTGGEVVAEYLIAEGMPHVCGIPGHGDMALFDAFKDRSDRISVLKPRHEQSAVHIADAYYRAGGEPLATMTSIGPGSVNTAVGLGTAYVDSIPVVAFTGGAQTYMYGRGVLQELERQHDSDFSNVMRPLVKRSFVAERPDMVPSVVQRAFNHALSGRPGPVHIELPMDVQAETTDVAIPDPAAHRPAGRVKADPDQIDRAAELLLAAKRPVILAGGGCVHAEAAAELRALAEQLVAPVVVTMTAKGVFPEDHPLSAEHTGANGTSCGNALTRDADVLLAVGTRFAEQTCSSYVDGESFSVPPTRIVHLDIDANEIGKNYPTEVGAVCDAKTGLTDLLDAVLDRGGNGRIERPEYAAEIQTRKQDWRDEIKSRWREGRLSMSRVLHEIRGAAPRETISIASAGHPQIQTFQEFLSYEPRTNLSPGGFSTMGYTLPAAIGAKLAQPERPVIGLAGDGDLLMTVQELTLAAELGSPIVIACLNSAGWTSIRDFQRGMFGEDRAFSVDFTDADGERSAVDFVQVAKAMGCEGERVERAEEVAPAVTRGLASGGPYVVDFALSSEPADSEGLNAGHWDLPKPAYLDSVRSD
ncbi:MAG: thiamine pyrophosphate-binding protein [Solirubrobacterales bacterium]